MKNNHLSQDLKELLNVSNELCVSLIIPQNELPSMKKLDKIAIDHVIEKLGRVLNQSHDAAVAAQVIDKLKKIEVDLSRINGVKGIGIFISGSLFKLLTFPFEVKEKI